MLLIIPCDCTSCTSIIDQPSITDIPAHQQPCQNAVKEFTYWDVLGSFNNCNILKLSQKPTSSKEIDKIHQVVLAGISENMAALLQTYEYSFIHTTYITKMGYYVIEFM